MKVSKLFVCKEPTFYQSVQENVSESLLHTLFLHKTIQLSLLIYSQPPVVRHFTNWWHLSHFPWTTAFTRTFATSILRSYNFNWMIKWYDISCANLYDYVIIIFVLMAVISTHFTLKRKINLHCHISSSFLIFWTPTSLQ